MNCSWSIHVKSTCAWGFITPCEVVPLETQTFQSTLQVPWSCLDQTGLLNYCYTLFLS